MASGATSNELVETREKAEQPWCNDPEHQEQTIIQDGLVLAVTSRSEIQADGFNYPPFAVTLSMRLLDLKDSLWRGSSLAVAFVIDCLTVWRGDRPVPSGLGQLVSQEDPLLMWEDNFAQRSQIPESFAVSIAHTHKPENVRDLGSPRQVVTSKANRIWVACSKEGFWLIFEQEDEEKIENRTIEWMDFRKKERAS